MFSIKTEADLLNAFRPRDRASVELPAGLSFPHFVRDYLAWVEPAGVRVFLVFEDPASKRPLGIAFQRVSSAGGAGPQLCEWCHAYGSASEVGLLTADRNSRRRVGVALCRDLRCADKIEQAGELSGRSTVEPRHRLVERMVRFAREGLGIESVPLR
jgi:hypothetical protein